jgi:anthraniloyl-CoA monooxygenase
LVIAPPLEADLEASCAQLAGLAEHSPTVVAVYGGTALTRSLLCERARLGHGLAALLIDQDLDRDQAVTAVLSGRADLVGVPAGVLRGWQVPA